MVLFEGNGEEYEKGSVLGPWFSTYMRIFAVAGYAWLLVSAVHIFTTGTSEGVSLLAITLYMSLSVSFLCHGLLRNDLVVVTASLVALTCNLVVIAAIITVNAPIWKH